MNKRAVFAKQKPRFLFFGLASLFSVLTAPVIQAMGLGDVSLRSVLGDPLEARIQLIDDQQQLDPALMKVRHLSVKDAEEMGVELISYFHRFQLQTIEENGRPVIRLFSREPVTEPFIHLFIELKWPTGAVYREYTLLVDVPAEIQAKPVASQPAGAAVAKVSTRPSSATVKPSVKSAAATVALGEGSYQVQSGDSLSLIATRLTRSNSYSRQQAMNWIHQHNPSAFINNDPNRIKAYVNIQLPSSRQLADSQVAVAATPVIVKKSVASTPQPMTDGLVKPKSAELAKKKAVEARLSLQAAAEVSQTDSLRALEEQKLEDRIRQTQELNDQLRRENQAIEARIRRLEGSNYLQSLERLVELREQEIAELEAKLQGSSSQASKESADALVNVDTQAPVESSEQASPLWLWLLLVLGLLGSGYFYWHQKLRDKTAKTPTNKEPVRDESAELARLEAALEEQDESLGFDPVVEDINFSSLFGDDGQPTGAPYVGRYKPDPELSQKIQEKTKGYVNDNEGVSVLHHDHDNLDDLIAEALSLCSAGDYDQAEQMLMTEKQTAGDNLRIKTALDYVANLKKRL